MHFNKHYTETLFRVRVVLIFLAMFILPSTTKGDCRVQSDTADSIAGKKRNFIHKSIDFINGILAQDTTYVSPNRFNLRVMPQYSYKYEYYVFSTKDKEQSITLTPTSNNKIGIYLGWRYIVLGYSFNIGENQPEFDMALNLYCSRGGIELFYRKRSDGYRIRSVKGFEKDGLPITGYDRDFDGFSITQGEAKMFYVFNYKKFSFPAAYRQSTNQRISAGSVIMGVSYKEQMFMFDYKRIDNSINELLKPEMKFQNVDYKDISINIGYSYNWVFAKDFLANITLSPSIGYKNTSLKFYKNSRKEFISSINFDLVSRLALVYNNSRFYAGASLISHTYSYNNSSLSIVNGLGTISVYVGVNIWRRKR